MFLMKKLMFVLLGVIFSCGYYSCDSDDPKVTASPVGSLETLQSGFSFTEGPAVDKNGNVFFTDQPNDKIYKWDVSTGAIVPFLEEAGRSNGMAFDKDGYLIACADMHGELWRIAPDGSHE